MDYRLRLDAPNTHLMVLTGAGISVESGLSTYRAMNGLWKEHPVKEVATPYGRPAVVWFAEPIAQPDMDRVERFMVRAAQRRFLFLAVGTSGIVTPASAFVEEARKLGAETWLVNLEPPPNRSYFDHFLQGESGTVLCEVLGTS